MTLKSAAEISALTGCPFWVYLADLADAVPVPSEFGLDSSYFGLGHDISEWFAAREQLWAMREGLA